MKNILNLFRPSAKEQQLEAELSGSTPTRKPSATSAQPPRRRGTASPASITHLGADVSELSELRASLASVEARLQAATSERDSLKAEFSQYRSASQADVRDLESENRKLRESLDATSMLLSKQIAGSGLDAPLPGISASDNSDGPRGLARAIMANKQQASTTPLHQRHERIL